MFGSEVGGENMAVALEIDMLGDGKAVGTAG
jgi:hypothetical protein